MTTDVLPDDVLIEIFDFHLNGMSIFDDDMNDEYGMIRWHTLVHVCQRWRQLIFTSPCRLGLVLEYNGKKPMREMLDVWPVLPIAIRLRALESLLKPSHADNIVDALDLENHARIHEIKLDEFPRSHWDRFVGAMQKPFPQLRNLQIGCSGGATAVLPISDLFLGGSVSHLQKLRLENIQFPFPGVQKQLLTANNLVELSLWTTPLSGYISPEAMVICLSAMPRLEILLFRVDFPRFRPDMASQRPPPLTRSVIPALTFFDFEGVYEYLEDLIARIDTPILQLLHISFFMDLMFDVPQLHRFINRTEKLKKLDYAGVTFVNHSVYFRLFQAFTYLPLLELEISCRQSDWLLSSVAQVCSSSFPPFSTLEHLRIIHDSHARIHWKGDVEISQWQDLLDPFTSLKNLYLSEDIAPQISKALQDLSSERVSELLPALQNLYISQLEPSGPVQEAIGRFVAERQRSGNPVVVHRWKGS